MTSTMMMSMDGMSMTATAAAATSTAAMSMDMGDGGSCKISMLWNWYTVDSCFISSTWHITSSGMFAGSCIGVVILVMALEFLRRLGKEYDQYILRQATKNIKSSSQSSVNSAAKTGNETPDTTPLARAPRQFRPSLFQQTIRAGLHMVQFAVAYFIMLLAMYYNGYIIICIIIGAFLGSFTFSWETMKLGDAKEEVTFCCG